MCVCVCVCVCFSIVALVIRNANCILYASYYSVICDLSGPYHFFAYYLINGTMFGKH